jgi:hypothetical protein
MKPIAQTFIIPEPDTGVEAVFLTGVNLYFQSKSSTYGVEVQIRETVNGVPSRSTLPYASKILESANVNISSDSSASTSFTFDTPVLIRSNEQFAIVVVPVGGNPDYNIWTASLGDTDVKNNVPIYTSNQLGSLFISTNDLNFTPIQSESMKYDLVTATFTASSGTAVYRNSNTDFFKINNTIGNFVPGEQVVVSNSYLSMASLTVSVGTAFTVGETIVQPNTATTIYNATAYGKVLLSNTTTTILGNTSGAFTTTGGGLKGLSSAITSANATAANISVVTTTSNTITVPVANLSVVTDITTNNYIYVGTNTRSTMKVAKITGTSTAGLVSTISLDSNVGFSDTAAIIGRVRADANLYGYYAAGTRTNLIVGSISIDGVTSNASQNFANTMGAYLIGRSSGASSKILDIANVNYDSITTQFADIEPKQTSSDWYFSGTSNAGSRDSSYYSVNSNIPYEFIDKERVIRSRSLEYVANASGGSSLYVQTQLGTSNTMISPYIDRIRNSVAVSYNDVINAAALSGYFISYSNSTSNATNKFAFGDTIWQSNSTVNSVATILNANSSVLVVSAPTSSNTLSIATFNANSTSFITDATSGVVANVSAVTAFSETNNPITRYGTRYISKNVVLADQQDAEDLIAYIAAYRPAGTNFQVYCKLLAAADNDSFDSKHWSLMTETSSPALLSSSVNRDDLVELSYDLPTSVQVYTGNVSANSTSANLTFDATITTASFTPGQFIYIADIASTKFNVRQIVSIPNTSTITLNSNISIVTTNAAIGYIPGLASQYGAFRYSNNQSIGRYMNSTDSAFDSFKTFAVKIVLTSNTTYVVPRMSDFRAIALQV